MVWKQSQRRWSWECPKSPVQSLPCSWWGRDWTKWSGIKQLCNAGGFWQMGPFLWGWHAQSTQAWLHMLAIPLVYQSPSPRTLMSGQFGACLYRWWISCFPWKSFPSLSFPHWGSLRGDKKFTAPWRLSLLLPWLPRHSLQETAIWTWFDDCSLQTHWHHSVWGRKKKYTW